MKRFLASLLLALITACAPLVQRQSPAVMQPHLATDGFTASDGTALAYRAWLPSGAPKAIIVAVHGFNDYSHGYQLPGEYLRLRGIALFTYDQRGFGTSPPRGIWAGEDNLVRDADDMIRAVRAAYPQTPVYLLGESMGGAIAAAAAEQPDFPAVDGIILSAPALVGGSNINPLIRLAVWTSAHIAPGKKFTGMDFHILATDNIDALRDFSLDPLVIKATRLDAVYGLIQLMDSAYAHLDRIRAPVLLLYGAHDELVPAEPIQNALRRLPPGARAAYYPLGYHMLLRDLHGDLPARDILAWIGDKDIPLPSRGDLIANKFLK